MTSRIRNIFLKIMIILISITLFGFQNVPVVLDPGTMKGNETEAFGYVELMLYSQVSAGAGSGSVNFTWHPVQVFLPIIGRDSRGNSIFNGGAFTFALGSGHNGPIVVQSGWPVYWHIQGTVAPSPDCTITLTVDETWLPGYDVGCEPTGIVGCVYDRWPPGHFPGSEFKIPFNKAWGTVNLNASGLPIGLTVIVQELLVGGEDLRCTYHLYFPVIPQAPE